MISVTEAMRRIVKAMPARPSRSVGIADACGKVLAQDIRAERDQPPFDRVMMDGIAICYDAFSGGRTRFQRQGIQAAGAPAQVLDDPTHCIEVMTGAVLPERCDCIIPIEQIELSTEHAELHKDISLQKGQFIHRAASDYDRNAILLRSGTAIGAPEMAVLASAGAATVTIAQEPTVMIFAVGDELVDPGDALGPAQIRRSNDYAIDALLRKWGTHDNVRAKLPDEPNTLREEIGKALESYDLVILTGGVSMGKYDYIPSIMDELGVEILLHKVAQTPGKPMWVGRKNNRMVFALPGNPVSALVCARRYVIPAIHSAMNMQQPPEWVPLSRSIELKNTLAWFVPVRLHRLESAMTAEPRLPNTSGDFHTLAGTTGFIELPTGPGTVSTGYASPLWRW